MLAWFIFVGIFFRSMVIICPLGGIFAYICSEQWLKRLKYWLYSCIKIILFSRKPAPFFAAEIWIANLGTSSATIFRIALQASICMCYTFRWKQNCPINKNAELLSLPFDYPSSEGVKGFQTRDTNIKNGMDWMAWTGLDENSFSPQCRYL